MVAGSNPAGVAKGKSLGERGMRSHANFWSRASGGLMVWSHMRAAGLKWGVLFLLALVWLIAGYLGFVELLRTENAAEPAAEAVYRTLGGIASSDVFFNPPNALLEISRFAGLAVPVIGLVFTFSGELGRSLARVFFAGASNHIVIAGDDPPAVSLAQDCAAHRDSVVIIGQHFTEETAWAMRRHGVTVVEGDAGQSHTLRAARAHRASHVVAMEQLDTTNLQVEAALLRLAQDEKPRRLIHAHIGTRAPMLLKEAREMCAHVMRKHEAKVKRAQERKRRPPRLYVDPMPFSLDELAARCLAQTESTTIMDVAEQLGHPRLHLMVFGYDEAGDALAARMLMSAWSARFGAPRITFVTPDPARDQARFQTRYPEAFAHPHLWAADVAFLPFDWLGEAINPALLQRLQEARGQPSAIIVSTGSDSDNIQLALSLKRICNQGYAWPAPIFMKEASRSEFSQQYAKGDETEELDAYLQAFGAHQQIATRDYIILGMLDRGAAIAHEHYNKQIADHDAMSLKDLQAAMKHWSDVLETYRAANRAVADAALIKLWDAGWRPARKGEDGETEVRLPDEVVQRLSEVEHCRWMAERLMAGWRPGEQRSNELMVHNQLKPWSALSQAEKDKDAAQVRASVDIARLLHPAGFVRREVKGQVRPAAA
ncbi:MAG: hypothetical protein GC189_08235 [Alphaproteobacteria bacterium]|nr:hypothetical protein [Alphaproteobacteria bacterium]